MCGRIRVRFRIRIRIWIRARTALVVVRIARALCGNAGYEMGVYMIKSHSVSDATSSE